MRTWFPVLVVVIVTAVTARSYAAGPQVGPLNGPLAQPQFNPQDNAKPTSPNPFGSLFPPAPQPELFPIRPLKGQTFTFNPQVSLPTLTRLKPRVVCGLVIIPVDPHLDPKFVREIPKDATQWPMKVIPMPPCEK
jgi:hypothetical protein